MLVMGVKPGHDGAVAAIEDRRLLLSLEAEKDSWERHCDVTPMTFLDAAEHIGGLPDVIGLGGWRLSGGADKKSAGAGYHGVEDPVQRTISFFGRTSTLISSSHVRSHIMAAVGLSPAAGPSPQAVLVWEGITGSFYLLDEDFRVVRTVPVLTQPGARYAFLFAVADPTFPDDGAIPSLDDSGKLMGLAAYGDPDDADAEISQAIDQILKLDTIYPAPKSQFWAAPFYNTGVASAATKTAAALLNVRLFGMFAEAAERHLPAGIPLRISGGCGLNCDWNVMWRGSGQFSSVFVPPCPNDSGSALGTAIDALQCVTGSPYIEWDVYSGLEFRHDTEPSPELWLRRPADPHAVARAIGDGHIMAWVQGRWEIGPRALGARSILAEPFHDRTRDRLNAIKKREDYRPIAPCCRIEDVSAAFGESFPDPYMLYFRTVRSPELKAVTHVDGSARAQTVTRDSNPPLHRLLTAFASQYGLGVLCNTSLNFKARGFINTMSELAEFCESHDLDGMVVGDAWYERRRGRVLAHRLRRGRCSGGGRLGRDRCRPALPPEPAEHRKPREVRPSQGDAAHPDVDRDPALFGPVHVFQVDQQGELVHDQGQAAAVADGHGRVPAVPLLAPDGDRADAGQQADAPHVVVQVLAADADVAERPLTGPDAVGEGPQPGERPGEGQPAEQGRPLARAELLPERAVDGGRRGREVGHAPSIPAPTWGNTRRRITDDLVGLPAVSGVAEDRER